MNNKLPWLSSLELNKPQKTVFSTLEKREKKEREKEREKREKEKRVILFIQNETRVAMAFFFSFRQPHFSVFLCWERKEKKKKEKKNQTNKQTKKKKRLDWSFQK